ncbi:hypothetical protein DL771_002452 [Monosporascus sp. 5C6A]|nr:hypothetical protein DL771_002452 [Monosporascus sp. 5C6A]
MGAYYSVENCKNRHGVDVDCTIGYNDTTQVFESISIYQHGEFEGDPDIAGVGILGVFIAVTSFALLISIIDVNANTEKRFPTDVPASEEEGVFLFWPAACFQDNTTTLLSTVKDSTSSGRQFLNGVILNSTPNNHIRGWNWYVIIVLFYGVALIAEFVRFCRRQQNRPGWRARLGDKIRHIIHPHRWVRRVISFIFLVYLLGGIVISGITVYQSGRYMYALRSWVAHSGWMKVDELTKENPENDAKTFGQLVPIFLSALIVFGLAQTISEKITDHSNRKHVGEPQPQPHTIQYLDPSKSELGFSPQMKTDNNGGYFLPQIPNLSVSPGCQASLAAHPPRTSTNITTTSFGASSVIIGGNGSATTTPAIPQPSRFAPMVLPGTAISYDPLPGGSDTPPEVPPQGGSQTPPQKSPLPKAQPQLGTSPPSQRLHYGGVDIRRVMNEKDRGISDALTYRYSQSSQAQLPTSLPLFRVASRSNVLGLRSRSVGAQADTSVHDFDVDAVVALRTGAGAPHVTRMRHPHSGFAFGFAAAPSSLAAASSTM